jgi:hypothetical protein
VADFAADTFNGGTPGNDLGGTTASDSGTWTEHSNYGLGAVVFTNQTTVAIRNATAADAAAYYHSGTPASADYEVAVDLVRKGTPSTNASVGPAGRVNTAANTMYVARFVHGTGWSLLKIVTGTATSMGSSSATLTADQVYRVVLRMVNTAITIWVDGVAPFTPAPDSSISPAGKAGIRTFLDNSGTNSMYLDNFAAGTADATKAFPPARRPYRVWTLGAR